MLPEQLEAGSLQLTHHLIGAGANVSQSEIRVDFDVGRLEVGALTQYIHDNLIPRGWTLIDELRVAQTLVDQFGGDILEYDSLKQSISPLVE